MDDVIFCYTPDRHLVACVAEPREGPEPTQPCTHEWSRFRRDNVVAGARVEFDKIFENAPSDPRRMFLPFELGAAWGSRRSCGGFEMLANGDVLIFEVFVQDCRPCASSFHRRFDHHSVF